MQSITFKIFIAFALTALSCQNDRQQLAMTENKSETSKFQGNTTTDTSAFANNQQNSQNQSSADAFGDSTEGGSLGDDGNTKGKCFVVEYINDTYGFSSLFKKRGKRQVAVYMPLPETMQNWHQTPPSEAEARSALFGIMGNVKTRKGRVEKVQAKYTTNADAGPGSVPEFGDDGGQKIRIHENGEFGTKDCPKKLITKEGFQSPLIIDLSGKGLVVSSVSDGVTFDIEGSGSMQVAWPRYKSDTPWLVYDSNLNGEIDGIDEMFGNNTGRNSGKNFANGFEALAVHDLNKDGKIDRNDQVFESLQLWTDRNRNGKAESHELESVRRRISEISLGYIDRFEQDDEHGNASWQRSTVQVLNGPQVVIYDLWLATKN